MLLSPLAGLARSGLAAAEPLACRHLQIYAPDSTRPRVLGIYLHASHTDRDEPGTRDDVICSFKIINFAKIKKSCRGTSS